MNRLYVLSLLLIAVLASCDDKIDLDKLDEPCLVVYSFPAPGDSLDIEVSPSQSVGRTNRVLEGLSLTCQVNGMVVPVSFVGTENKESHLSVERYRIHCPLHEGDEVSIHASADSFPSVTSVAIIPSAPDMPELSLDTVYAKGDWYTQIRCRVKNQPQPEFFAIRVMKLRYWIDDEVKILPAKVETTIEPLLNNYNFGNEGFNTKNEFYHGFYIFDDTGMPDSTYTLRLNIEESGPTIAYSVQFFALTVDFYRYLKSLNDIKSNDFYKYGMSFLRPSFSNITHGVGVLGAYSMVQTDWIK